MKTAIVCDWLVVVGGAEKFLGHLIDLFPDAEIFAIVDFIPASQRYFLKGKKVTTTFIQRIPFAKSRYRHMLPLMPLAIEQLDLSSFDLIISSSHAVAKGVLTGPDQLHISYVHSPMRYAWDLQHQYLQETGLNKKTSGILARYFLHKLRLWDLRSAQNVDHFTANSHFIARRIEKTYRRPAEVIYPPIELSRFNAGKQKDNFYLAASRLVPYKRMDLIVESFRHMPDKQLIVIGDGPELNKLRKLAGKNVSLLGYQSSETLIDHMQRAKALIFAAEEDFGLIPLESQACGTPVIAYGKGGALETVRGLEQTEPTGVFFHEQSERAICEAIALFEDNKSSISTQYCLNQASQFSPEQFKQQFGDFVKQKMAEFRQGCLPPDRMLSSRAK